MRTLIGLSLLVLLAPPLAAQGAAATPPVTTGSLEVDVDPATISYLPVDSTFLQDNLCDGVPPVQGPGTLTPRGECDLSVSPAPRIGFFAVETKAGDGSIHLVLQPADWETWTASAAVATPCGRWEVSLMLDTRQEQPLSDLALEPSPGAPAQGVFAVVATVAVRYRFVNQDHGTTLELPAALSLELSGHWGIVPPGTSLGAGASNLLLFAGFAGGTWTSFPSSATWGGTGCNVALRPPNVLDTLNGTPSPRR